MMISPDRFIMHNKDKYSKEYNKPIGMSFHKTIYSA